MKVDLERLRRVAKYVRFDGKPGPAVYGHELEALLAVVDAARHAWCAPGPERTAALLAALEPFTPPTDRAGTCHVSAVRHVPDGGRVFNDDRAWEEVDRWNRERDLAVKAAVDATKGNPRDRARDQLADAGVAVQRQFRSDQERIAELERECDLRVTESASANELITEIKNRLSRVPALVEALRDVLAWPIPGGTVRTYALPARLADKADDALAEWEKP